MYSVGDAEAEVIEAQVMATSPIAGRPLSEIEFPEGALVGAILKTTPNGPQVLKPTGKTRLEPDDTVVIFALARDVPEVERLLQVSIDFF